MEKDDLIRKNEIVFILILIAIIFALRLPHMFDALDREEGLFAYTAGLTYYGDLPYKDVFDNNPPFIFYIYKAAFDLFGKTVEAIRNFTSVYVVFCMLLLYMFSRTFTRASTAMTASLLYVIFLNNVITRGFVSGPGIFTHFTVIFSLLFLLDRDKTYERANFFLAGFFMSTAVLTSTVILPAVIVPVVYVLVFIKEKKRAGTGVFWYLTGFFTVVLLAVLWSVKNSIYQEFIDAVVIYNLKEFLLSVKTNGIRSIFPGLAAFMAANLLLAAAFIYSAVRLFMKKQDQLNFVLFFTTFAIMAGVMAGKNAQVHDYAVLIPCLCLLAALMIKDGLDAVIKIKTGGKAPVAAVFVLILAGLVYSVHATGYLKNFLNAGEKDAVFSEARVIAAEINSVKTPATLLFVWPNDPEIYFYTGIKAGQRFVTAANYWLYKDEFRSTLSILEALPPDFIVLEKGPDEILFDKPLKKYYSKSLEGKKFVLYKKGGSQ